MLMLNSLGSIMTLKIITGSTLGSAEDCATELADFISKNYQENPQVVHNPTLEQVKDATHLIFVVATHGEGDYPMSFEGFAEDFAKAGSQGEADAPLPQAQKILLIGLGSTEYDQFCGAIKKFAQLLAAKGYNPVSEPAYIDMADFSTHPDDTISAYFQAQAQAFLN